MIRAGVRVSGVVRMILHSASARLGDGFKPTNQQCSRIEAGADPKP